MHELMRLVALLVCLIAGTFVVLAQECEVEFAGGTSTPAQCCNVQMVETLRNCPGGDCECCIEGTISFRLQAQTAVTRGAQCGDTLIGNPSQWTGPGVFSYEVDVCCPECEGDEGLVEGYMAQCGTTSCQIAFVGCICGSCP